MLAFATRPELSTSIPGAVDQYLTTTSTMLTRAVSSGVSALLEPRTSDPERALALIDPLIATLTGFALGCIGEGLIDEIRLRLGTTVARGVRAYVVARWPHGPLSAPPSSPAPFLADAAERPLVDALAGGLLARLRLLAPELRRLAHVVDAALKQFAPTGTHVGNVLHGASTNDRVQFRMTEEIATAWNVYRAALGRTQMPDLAERPGRSRALWEAWWQRVTGERREAVRTATEQDGFIALIR